MVDAPDGTAGGDRDSESDAAGVTRRQVLAAGIVAGAGGGVFYSRDSIGEAIAGGVQALEDYDDPRYESIGLSEHRWDGSTLHLEFTEDHGTDGWTISHEQDDHVDGALLIGAVPEPGGSIEIPFGDVLADEGRMYPTGTFDFAAFEGEFSAWDTANDHEIGEFIGSISFQAPADVIDDYRGHDD